MGTQKNLGLREQKIESKSAHESIQGNRNFFEEQGNRNYLRAQNWKNQSATLVILHAGVAGGVSGVEWEMDEAGVVL